MKKIMTFIGCALFVAAMSVSCNGKSAEEVVDAIDSTNDVVAEAATEAAVTAVTATADMTDAEREAMLEAAREAGRAKCNCFKTDSASVEACIKSILEQQYAAYQGNSEFVAAMEIEYKSCLREKAAETAKEAANKGIKAGANEINKRLGKK